MLLSMYHVLAFYHFTHLEDPEGEVRRHKAFFQGRDVRARIYISKEGINGQMSAHAEDSDAYRHWLKEDPRFESMPVKVHHHKEHVFPRLIVKTRDQLVAIDCSVKAEDGGEHVSPAKWRELLESKERPLLLDVRNDYEWEVGHFEGAEKPDCKTFRDFPEYAKNLKKKHDPSSTPVMMYCTGGIRCELYSALLKEHGFDTVYQLDGGVIQYGLEEGTAHWEGKLFVFDDRMVTEISDDSHSVTGRCHKCNVPCDTYYNCANMDCNALFLSCEDCLKETRGTCKAECLDAPRLRQVPESPKPFRRLSESGVLSIKR